MRSWNLVCASLLASLVSVLSFVIPFCLFLNFQQNHLIHVVSDGMEVMLYLTPFLVVFAFTGYLIILALLKLPTKIFDLSQFIKVSLILLSCWTFLVSIILLEDQVNYIDFSTLKIGILIYFAILPIVVLGCMSANSCYFVMSRKIKAKVISLTLF
ncbi:hypothetical protein QTA56_06330 [Acinetobacter sp. VNH17]|uniref:Uncharacterized protein n=1 Tax=Acinetobacter thutiue TaxID=2998078 RepID=A0ABT7WME1_9GAMM|nr:hypothetical protein [Acinetobacter thutiue]MCY6411756.1 hypothetical protein [Acinetobacter thutiue]MDM1021003.1 hypothetical protein [Acinetobacter thutiue]MDN0013858.1 hypothetical protein [Acinetobacter thutiue]